MLYLMGYLFHSKSHEISILFKIPWDIYSIQDSMGYLFYSRFHGISILFYIL